MNTKSVLLLFAVVAVSLLFIREPTAVAAPGDDDQNAKLIARIVALEKLVQSQQAQSQEISSLKFRLIRLERTVQTSRPSVTSSTSVSPNDIAQLKRDSVSLKSSVRRLESKITGFDRSNLQREIDSLRQKVLTLQSAVKRLESKR